MLSATWRLEIKAHGAACDLDRLWWMTLDCVSLLSRFGSVDSKIYPNYLIFKDGAGEGNRTIVLIPHLHVVDDAKLAHVFPKPVVVFAPLARHLIEIDAIFPRPPLDKMLVPDGAAARCNLCSRLNHFGRNVEDPSRWLGKSSQLSRVPNPV